MGWETWCSRIITDKPPKTSSWRNAAEPPPPQLPRKLRRLSGPIPLPVPTTRLTQCWRRVDSTAGQAARHLLAGTLSNKWETWCSRIITDKPPKTSSWRNAAEPPPPQPRKLPPQLPQTLAALKSSWLVV